MQRFKLLVGCVCAMALLGMGMLGGCGEQAQETDAEGPPPEMQEPAPEQMDQSAEETDDATDDAAEEDEGAGDDSSAEALSGDAKKLADVMKQWPSSFVMTAKMTNKDSGQTSTSTNALKLQDTEPLKMKAQMQGGGVVLDYEANVMYSWDASSDTATKMDLPERRESAQNPYQSVNPDTKIVGSETIDGVDCWVTETARNGETVKTWVAKDNGLMQKMESPDVTVEYEYDQIGSVPDSEFQVPDGMAIEEIERPQMPEGMDMQDMPEDMPGR